MRNAFIEEIVAAAQTNPDLILMTGDLGWGVLEPFIDRFPNQFVNAGVAEQNMMGMAAGMASEGCHVFVYSLANFPTFRCAEQIRNDVDYHKLPVTIVAVGGGVDYGALGYSHHAVQDYALMRAMPNMLIASPCDDNEARACIQYLVTNPQPSYLRLGRGGEPQIFEEVPRVEPGKWVFAGMEGTDREVVHVSTGTAAQFMRLPGLHFTLPLWGMKQKHKQATEAHNYLNVATYENHLEDAGFGSWMMEALHVWDISVSIHGLKPKVCGMVGSREYLQREGRE